MPFAKNGDRLGCMRVLFDHQIFSFQQYGGIARYLAMLARQFETNKSFDCTPVYLMQLNVNKYFHDLAIKHGIKNVVPDWRRKFFIYYLKNYFYAERNKSKTQYDLIHPTFYDPYILKKRTCPLVLTIHDMTTERFPELFCHSFYGKLVSSRWIQAKKKLAYEADAIIAVSESTKKDVIKIYDIPEDKIEVIYHGFTPFPQIQKDIFFDKPYLLYVGERKGYKNFSFFVASIAEWLRKNNIYLFCAGGNPFSPEEKSLFVKYNIVEQIVQRNVTDPELAAAYRDALAFVYPSLYEGFGIPILEAFSVGTPCILAKNCCFPEIAKDAAVYFDPYSADSVLHAVEQVISSLEIRAELGKKGRCILQKFSWHECAEKTVALYKRVLR